MLNPVCGLNDIVMRRILPDDDLLNAGIQNQALAHGAGLHCAVQPVGFGVMTGEVERGAEQIGAACADDCVHFRMDAAAQLIALTPRNLHPLTVAEIQITAILPPARCAVVAGRDDLVMLDNDGAEFPAQACAARTDRLGNVQIVVDFISALHDNAPFGCFFHYSRFSRKMQDAE